MKILILILISCFAIQIVLPSRILFLFPTFSKSHLIVVEGLSVTLAQRGHDVTIATPFPRNKPTSNYREILIPLEDEDANYANDMVQSPSKDKQSSKLLPKLMKIATKLGSTMLELPEFRRMMDEEKFDLVVTGMFMNNFLLGVGDHFKCPTIILCFVGSMAFTHHLVGNPLGTSAVPHMSLESTNLNFYNRVWNFIIHASELSIYHYMNYVQKELYE